MERQNILEVRGLKTYFKLYEGTLKAVDDIDFSVGTGRTLGIIGESGCGKSVTAHSILNTVQAPGKIVAGQVRYRSEKDEILELAALPPNGSRIRSLRGREISMIFQEPMTSMAPVYTIGQQMVEAYLVHQPRRDRATKARAAERAKEMLAAVGMSGPVQRMGDYPHQLSGGMCHRAMIALSLMLNPRILIADEPTTALDVTVQAQIVELLVELKQKLGMSIIYITHDMGVIAGIADDLCVMYLGRIIEQGAARQIFHNPVHPYTVRLLRSIPRLGRKVPDARLDAIRGNVPVPLDPRDECGFCSRCDEMQAGLCDQAVPGMVEVEPGHLVRCVKVDGKRVG